MAAHPDADDRDLGDPLVVHDPARADLLHDLGELRDRPRVVAAGQRERHVGETVLADVLHDHVDHDVAGGDRAEDARGDAGAVGHSQDRDLRLAPVVRDAGDHRLFHAGFLLRHERARIRAERGAHVDRDVVFLRELDGARLEHLRAEARELEHLVVGDARELSRVGHDVRVGGVHAVDIGVDLAHVRLQRRRQRDRGEVGAAPPERRDLVLVREPLESGNDRDLAGVERPPHAIGIDLGDPRLRVRVIGAHADLRAGEGPCLETERLER